MAELMALDVAILLPPHVSRLAIDLNSSLRPDDSEGLTLDPDHLPHITLVQLFVREEDLETAFQLTDAALRGQPPLRLRVAGSTRHGTTLWLAIEPDPPIMELHERLMHELRAIESADGGPGAFLDEEVRVADVLWVAGYRLKASFGAFRPHVTLAHVSHQPEIEPFDFDADTVAACHLGRFCTCRRVLRSWTLGP